MKPLVEILIYSFLEKQWVILRKEFSSIIDSVNIALQDFDIDNFSVTMTFPQNFSLYTEFLNSPYWLEGNLITFQIGYLNFPTKKTVVMNGVITGSRVKESVEEVVYTIQGTDMSILLKGKVTNADILKTLSSNYIKNPDTRNNAAVLLTKDILRKNKEILSELNKEMQAIYSEMPDFGLNFTSDSIPDVSEEELRYRRFVHINDMSSSEKITAKEEGAEWGIADKPASQQFLESLKAGSGYEIFTTYIETISSLGVILGRMFWYDSKYQKCYFKRPQDINNRNSFTFVKSNQIGINPFERILDFEVDYSTLDSVWAVQSSFVSVYKTSAGDVRVKPIIIRQDSENFSEETETKENQYTNTEIPIVLGASEFSSLISKGWELIHRTSPDSFELMNSANQTFYLKEFTVKGELSIQGNPDIRPHDIVWVFGVGNKFEGAWFVSSVMHDLSPEKYITTLEVTRNILAVPKTVSGKFIEHVNKVKLNALEKTDASGEDIKVIVPKQNKINIPKSRQEKFLQDKLKHNPEKFTGTKEKPFSPIIPGEHPFKLDYFNMHTNN
ncbi:MAG: hypothetical protein EOM67_00450 [Spirochaetia bacterium]|nr:hypothetical protein [Spirochaetia bacterium]